MSRRLSRLLLGITTLRPLLLQPCRSEGSMFVRFAHLQFQLALRDFEFR